MLDSVSQSFNLSKEVLSMMSFFEGMKASLDLATSASVIVAIVIYIQDKRTSAIKEKKEAEERATKEKKEAEERELLGALDRIRSSLEGTKNELIKKALELDILSRSNDEKESVLENLMSICGEVSFRLELLKRQVYSECDFFLSSIRDNDRYSCLKPYVEEEKKDFGFRLAVSIELLRYFAMIVSKQLVSTKSSKLAENPKLFSVLIGIISLESPMALDDLKKINSQGVSMDLVAIEKIVDGETRMMECGIMPVLDNFFLSFAEKILPKKVVTIQSSHPEIESDHREP